VGDALGRNDKVLTGTTEVDINGECYPACGAAP